MDKGRNAYLCRKLSIYNTNLVCLLKTQRIGFGKKGYVSGNTNSENTYWGHASPCKAEKIHWQEGKGVPVHMSKQEIQRSFQNIVQWAHKQFPLKLFFLLIVFSFKKFTKRACTLYVTSYKQVCGSLTPTLKAVPISW